MFTFAVVLGLPVLGPEHASIEAGDQTAKQQQEQEHPKPPAPPQKEPPPAGAEHEHMHKHPEGHEMIAGGPFKTMNAIGSGTSLLPATTPAYMLMRTAGSWNVMMHGELKTGFNYQGGPRGVGKAESQNMIMLMGNRAAGRGQFLLRGMFSAEPWTSPNGGFPELLQTGETYRRRPIIDAQHPHDLFMELSASYTFTLSERASFHVYGGPVAEPALGPVAFMHRASAMENPAAPLGHHLQDSTHIAHGVITTGVTVGRFRVESSVFRGAEPDENRHDIEMGKLDSWSARLGFTPTRDWSLQASHGHLADPEAARPGDIERTTASVAHNRAWHDGNVATALIWGRNHEEHGNFNSYLLESTVNFRDANYLYTRLELLDRAGLLEDNVFGRRGRIVPETHSDSESFRVGAFTFGALRDLVRRPGFRLGIGGDVTFYHIPNGLKSIYGSPTSFHLFLRLRPGKMSHP